MMMGYTGLRVADRPTCDRALTDIPTVAIGGECFTRPLTAEERARYGQPVTRKCAKCGKEKGMRQFWQQGRMRAECRECAAKRKKKGR